jgi:hypothetical protein
MALDAAVRDAAMKRVPRCGTISHGGEYLALDGIFPSSSCRVTTKICIVNAGRGSAMR